ncbi:hypothetical protein Tco_0719614 [Tanacetum coccineum]
MFRVDRIEVKLGRLSVTTTMAEDCDAFDSDVDERLLLHQTPMFLENLHPQIWTHFEGIQKALTKEIKEMKEIFEELEAEVDQHVVNRKHDEIERKNLLIANDNLHCRLPFSKRYAIDVEPIPPHNRNNREVHLDYLKHLKESVETLRKIVEEAKVKRPLG